MTIIGIDPGKSGGIAWLPEGLIGRAIKMPETPRDIWDLIDNLAKTYDGSMLKKSIRCRNRESARLSNLDIAQAASRWLSWPLASLMISWPLESGSEIWVVFRAVTKTSQREKPRGFSLT